MFSAFLLATVAQAQVHHIHLGAPGQQIVQLHEKDGGIAVLAGEEVLVFDDAAMLGYIGRTAALWPKTPEKCERYGGALLSIDQGLLVSMSGSNASTATSSSAVTMYDAPLSRDGPSVVVKDRRFFQAVELPGDKVVLDSHIFDTTDLMKGGNATTVLSSLSVGQRVCPFQGGVASAHSEGLLIFDADAIASGDDPAVAALEFSYPYHIPEDFPHANWRITLAELLCADDIAVLGDGALAVLGNCARPFGTANTTLLLVENIDFKAQTLHYSITQPLAFEAQSLLVLPDGRVAVGFCGTCHYPDSLSTNIPRAHRVEIFEESAFRSGGEPSLVLQTSGPVNHMAVLPHDRLAVATNTTVDIFEIDKLIRESIHVV